MKTVEITLYSFSELNTEAREKAINQRINDMIEFEANDHYENWPEFKKAIDKAESMYTPWFAGSYVWDYCGEQILIDLNDNGEIFLEDGSIH